jgi:hypothetical protein
MYRHGPVLRERRAASHVGNERRDVRGHEHHHGRQLPVPEQRVPGIDFMKLLFEEKLLGQNLFGENLFGQKLFRENLFGQIPFGPFFSSNCGKIEKINSSRLNKII